MSQYLVLNYIDIQNANSIAGLTWGFPAITHFLGFTHALNRKFSNSYEGNYASELTGCAVLVHAFQNKVYQPKKYADFEFLQSKNPPVLSKHKNLSPPIIEEGKMNLNVSLVVELNKDLILTMEQIEKLQKDVLSMCYKMRLAGGTILNIKQAKLLSANTPEQHAIMLRKIKKLTMPAFALLDRSDYLRKHYQSLLTRYSSNENMSVEPQLLDAWLDFSALKYKSMPQLEKNQKTPDENTPASWEYISKPNTGYLVPLMTGYKAISDLNEPGSVLNTRDEITPARFVESVHSVGEWKSIFSISNVDEIIWRYEHNGEWYLCKQNHNSKLNEELNQSDLETEQNQTLNFNEALNLF